MSISIFGPAADANMLAVFPGKLLALWDSQRVRCS